MTKSTPLSQLPLLGNSNVAQERQNQIPSLPLPVNTNIGNDINEDNDDTIMEALSQFRNGSPQNGSPQNRAQDTSPSLNSQFGSLPPGMPSQVSHGYAQENRPIDSSSSLQSGMQSGMQNGMQSGMQGNQGSQGSQGNQPIQNIQGMQPIQGSQGSQGSQNIQGVQGVQGVQGMGQAVKEQEQIGMAEYGKNDDVDYTYEEYIDESDMRAYNDGKKQKAASLCNQFFQGSELKRTLIVMVVFVVASLLPIEQIASKYIALNNVPFSNLILKTVFAGCLYFILTYLVE